VPARSKARKRALDILFEAELRSQPALAVLDERIERAQPPVSDYTAGLVRGIETRRGTIDRLLAENSHGWALDRMPTVDRNALRIGAYELLWRDDIPDAVAISEAVQLARELSTDESPGFVNGLLARLLELKDEITGEPDDEPEAEPEGELEPTLSECQQRPLQCRCECRRCGCPG
jgi:transcription antitermination protein NusB